MGALQWLRALALAVPVLVAAGVTRADEGPVDDRAKTAPEPAAPAPEKTESSSAPAQAADPFAGWCTSEVERLPNGVCYSPGAPLPGPHGAAASGRRTLVIFLHGLTDVGSGWQHSLQKGMRAAGKRLGFSVLAPHGRVGAGPGRKTDQVAWPTSEAARKAFEEEVLAEWLDAKAYIEKRDGAPFDEVFVMGFSNGAYYAAGLAIRGKLDVDGYAVFAGGSAPKGTESIAKATQNRKPIFVGVASKDDTAKKARELAAVLKKVAWPHEVESRAVGHVVADAHLEHALTFLRQSTKGGAAAVATPPAGAKAEAREPEKTAPTPPATQSKKKGSSKKKAASKKKAPSKKKTSSSKKKSAS